MSIPFFRDLGLKVFAIALAVLLWLTVAGDPIAERGLRVPLAFENVPGAMEILGDPPETVEVRLRGASGTLRRLDTADVAAIIDLGSERSGPRLFDMTVDQVRAPLGVEVTHVIPSTVSLTLEVIGSPRAVPVVPVVIGKPAPGFVVGLVAAEPATVEVVGPRSRLRELTAATTEPLDVSNASVPVEQTVTVGLADPNLRLTTPRTASVRVEIAPAPVERTLTDVPVGVRNVAPGLSHTVTPGTVAVTVHGPPDQMRGLDGNAVGASVDLADLGPGRYNLAVVVEPRRAVEVAHTEPLMVHVALQ